MKDFEKFKVALGDSCAPMIQSFLGRRWDDLPGVIRSYFGKRIDLTHVTTSSTEEFVIKLIHGLAGIESSLSCLADIESCLAAFPADIAQLRRVYLQVEAYLNEMDVLRDRVQAYYKCIPKLYRRDPLYPHILGVTSEISVKFEHLIDDILKLEDKHILGSHCRDEQLDVLVTLAAYAVSLDAAASERHQRDFETVLRRWQADMRANNQRISAHLDEGFAVLATVLLNPGGRLIQPRRV